MRFVRDGERKPERALDGSNRCMTLRSSSHTMPSQEQQSTEEADQLRGDGEDIFLEKERSESLSSWLHEEA